MDELEALRGELDAVDRDIVALFVRRLALTDRVADYKRTRGLPVLDAGREAKVLASRAEMAGDPAREADVRALFTAVMAVSRAAQARRIGEAQDCD